MRSNVVATVKYQCVETAVMLGMTHAVSAEPGIVTIIGRHIWWMPTLRCRGGPGMRSACLRICGSRLRSMTA